MKEQLLYNPLIRFDNVRAGVDSPLFEGVSTKCGRILVRDYGFASPWRPSVLFKKVLKELNGELGEELKRLRRIKLHPVLHVAFNVRCVTLFRVLISAKDLRRRKCNKQGIVISTPSSETVRNASKSVIFPVDVVNVLARYDFSIEIYGY